MYCSTILVANFGYKHQLVPNILLYHVCCTHVYYSTPCTYTVHACVQRTCNACLPNDVCIDINLQSHASPPHTHHSCSSSTLVWPRSTGTRAPSSTFPTERTRTSLEPHATPVSTLTSALNNRECFGKQKLREESKIKEVGNCQRSV